MKVKRILLVCIFTLILVLALIACNDDNIPPEHRHVIVIDEAVVSTCTSTGLTEGSHCSECGEIIVAQNMIPKNDNHIFVNNVCEICGELKYSEGLAYEIIDNNTCYISGIGSCTDLDIRIPEYIDGYKVTGIGESAFYECSSLKSIVIGNSVTSIGHTAFAGCTGLTSVVIPDSVTSIGHIVFYGCSSLASTVIPDSVTSIAQGMFYNCKNLTSIVIPDSVTSIGDRAFYNCPGLMSIEFEGTKAQWNTILKDVQWDSYTGNYTVYCTDGDITK